MGVSTEDEQSTMRTHHDQSHYDRQTIPGKLPSLQVGAYEACPGTKHSFASLSLPSLGVSVGASWPDDVERIDGRVDPGKREQNIQAAGSMRGRAWGRSGEVTAHGDNKIWMQMALTNPVTLGGSLRPRMVPADEDVALGTRDVSRPLAPLKGGEVIFVAQYFTPEQADAIEFHR